VKNHVNNPVSWKQSVVERGISPAKSGYMLLFCDTRSSLHAFRGKKKNERTHTRAHTHTHTHTHTHIHIYIYMRSRYSVHRCFTRNHSISLRSLVYYLLLYFLPSWVLVICACLSCHFTLQNSDRKWHFLDSLIHAQRYSTLHSLLHTHSSVRSHALASRCWVAAASSGLSLPSAYAICPWPQIRASCSNSSQTEPQRFFNSSSTRPWDLLSL
jgi:hypothetical protein